MEFHVSSILFFLFLSKYIYRYMSIYDKIFLFLNIMIPHYIITEEKEVDYIYYRLYIDVFLENFMLDSLLLMAV